MRKNLDGSIFWPPRRTVVFPKGLGTENDLLVIQAQNRKSDERPFDPLISRHLEAVRFHIAEVFCRNGHDDFKLEIASDLPFHIQGLRPRNPRSQHCKVGVNQYEHMRFYPSHSSDDCGLKTKIGVIAGRMDEGDQFAHGVNVFLGKVNAPTVFVQSTELAELLTFSESQRDKLTFSGLQDMLKQDAETLWHYVEPVARGYRIFSWEGVRLSGRRLWQRSR